MFFFHASMFINFYESFSSIYIIVFHDEKKKEFKRFSFIDYQSTARLALMVNASLLAMMIFVFEPLST